MVMRMKIYEISIQGTFDGITKAIDTLLRKIMMTYKCKQQQRCLTSLIDSVD